MQYLNLPDYIKLYLYSLKKNKRYEVYETSILMVLNQRFLKALSSLVEGNLENVKKENKTGYLNFEIQSTNKEYNEALELVCKSKYFEENMTDYEISRRKKIASLIAVEIVLQAGIKLLAGLNGMFSFKEIDTPTIDHKLSRNGHASKIRLEFDPNTPLNDIVIYLKGTLGITNKPKKKKLSLGEGLRVLQILKEIENNKGEQCGQKYEYKEQVIARRFFDCYGKKLSMPGVAKALQRINKVKKDINTKS